MASVEPRLMEALAVDPSSSTALPSRPASTPALGLSTCEGKGRKEAPQRDAASMSTERARRKRDGHGARRGVL